MIRGPLYVADSGAHDFGRQAETVDVVCAGDSLTGWNNYGEARLWPLPTYPQFLQEMCAPPGLRIVNGGVAGETSDNGMQQVKTYLEMFPHSRFFIIGFGTNDLASWAGVESVSEGIIDNLDHMVRSVRSLSRQPILLNVPYVNESMFPQRTARELRIKRDYHNSKLKEYCGRAGVPLTDICGHIRNEHFADELHPNETGARVIAEKVFDVLLALHYA